jgi:predicted PurR-regulated permease PerM
MRGLLCSLVVGTIVFGLGLTFLAVPLAAFLLLSVVADGRAERRKRAEFERRWAVREAAWRMGERSLR